MWLWSKVQSFGLLVGLVFKRFRGCQTPLSRACGFKVSFKGSCQSSLQGSLSMDLFLYQLCTGASSNQNHAVNSHCLPKQQLCLSCLFSSFAVISIRAIRIMLINTIVSISDVAVILLVLIKVLLVTFRTVVSIVVSIQYCVCYSYYMQRCIAMPNHANVCQAQHHQSPNGTIATRVSQARVP